MKGFTLIELMIVVAIIGLLSTVAVPSFLRYVDESKTAEGQMGLRDLADVAIAYYHTEHSYSTDGTHKLAGLYPGCGDDNAAPVACTGTESDHSKSCTPEKDTKKAGDYSNKPWLKMGFSMPPSYYCYTYSNPSDTSTFTATAVASLSGEKNSEFSIEGHADGKMGALVKKK